MITHKRDFNAGPDAPLDQCIMKIEQKEGIIYNFGGDDDASEDEDSSEWFYEMKYQ